MERRKEREDKIGRQSQADSRLLKREKRVKKAKDLTAILTICMMILAFPFTCWADEPDTSDAQTGETTEVTVVGSVEQLSRESAAADNEAYFKIDAGKKTAGTGLATDEIQEDVNGILSGDSSTAEKQDAIISSLEDSGYYTAEEGRGSKVEVISIFAYQRLRLIAPKDSEIAAYGAVKAVYYDDHYLLSYESEEATKQAYEKLVEEYGEDAVIVDMPLKISGDAQGWGTAYMGMDREKTKAAGGGTVTVAVLDTGIKRGHSVFSGRTILGGHDFVNNDSDPGDDNGHGTAVAGVISESTPQNVRIMPVKIMDSRGYGSVENLLSGIEFAGKHGADIINLSIGGELNSAAALKSLDEKLGGYGALIICAAGNGDSRGHRAYNMDAPGLHEFPAELSCTVCVGAFDTNGNICSFSNYGSAVDFAAPGSGLTLPSHGGGYFMNGEGTSFSAPYITSAAAIIKAEQGLSDKDDLRSALSFYAKDMGSKGKDVYFGYGCPVFEDGKILVPGGDIRGLGFRAGCDQSRTYNGSPQTVNTFVKKYWLRLRPGVDYSVSYRNNVNAGTATVVITGRGDYSGTVTRTFTIDPMPIRPQVRLSGYSYCYNGGSIEPEVSVYYGGRYMKNGSEYTVSYIDSINAGTAQAVVTCTGNYSCSVSTPYTILPVGNGMFASGKTAKVKQSALRKKARTVPAASLFELGDAQGMLSFRKVSGSKRLTISKSTGNVKVKKNTGKGKYKMKVLVAATGDGNHEGAAQYVNIVVKVR